MKAVIIYESLTGNTHRVAGLIADELYRHRVGSRLFATPTVDEAAVAAADLVIVGTWTDGLLLVGQRPGRKGRIKKLPDLTGKRCAVFCTYAVDPGTTLDKFTRLLADQGADVIGGMAIRRNNLTAGAEEFVSRVMDTVTV